MAFHHVAIATRDLAATHRFYTEAMGFRLVHVEAGAIVLHEEDVALADTTDLDRCTLAARGELPRVA